MPEVKNQDPRCQDPKKKIKEPRSKEKSQRTNIQRNLKLQVSDAPAGVSTSRNNDLKCMIEFSNR